MERLVLGVFVVRGVESRRGPQIMSIPQLAALLYVGLIVIVCCFQIALAAGAPWGELAMGGRFPGRLPPAMRVLALVQVVLLAAFAAIVLAKSGLALAAWRAASGKVIWAVVGIGALSMVMNLATPSRWERIAWGPVTVVLLAASLVVALS